MVKGPTHAIVAVTYRCNARCTMCDIWKMKPGSELRPEDYRRLPSSLRQINVTGGEPLLRGDLAAVVGVMQERCHRARVVLSTNGLLPDRLGRLLAQTRDVAVRVSLDGIGDVHNRIRGVDGAYDKALESLRVSRDAGVDDLGVCATMSRLNTGTMGDIYDFTRREGIQFTLTVAHSSPVFFGDQRSEEPSPADAAGDLAHVRDRFLTSRNPKDWFRGYYVGGLMDVVAGKPRPIRCRAGLDFFYLDPGGNVYPCHILDKRMGNLLEQSYEEIIQDNMSVVASVRECGKRCWMTCTVAPEMRRKAPHYALRVAWAKLLGHARAALGSR
jgi:MoaA/NifB/PqqE/SkfB family radical SAM enzyme